MASGSTRLGFIMDAWSVTFWATSVVIDAKMYRGNSAAPPVHVG